MALGLEWQWCLRPIRGPGALPDRHGGGICGRIAWPSRFEIGRRMRCLHSPSPPVPPMPEPGSVQLVASPLELSVSVDRSHGALVLTARGELDMASVALLEEELRRAESADVKQVVLDLAEVE